VAGVSVTLTATGLHKRFGPTVALAGVSLTCEGGGVHGLIGENGAGKSTFVKILSGVIRPDGGSVTLDGVQIGLGSPREARRAGIVTAFQELRLVPYMSVARNLMLGREPHGAFGFVSERRLEQAAAQELHAVGVDDIHVDVLVGNLPLGARQKLEIARALLQHPRVLLLDEPTSALTARDVEWLFQAVRRHAATGRAVLFVSHRLAEIRRVCDRITVLRDGAVVGSFDRGQVDEREIIRSMIGRSLETTFPERGEAAPASPPPAALLQVSNLTGPGFHNVSFEVRAGEILGVGGLQGQGHRELFMALFGGLPVTAGRVAVSGRRLLLRSPREAIAAGIGYIPEDRKTEGLLLELSGRENVALPSIGRFSRLGLVTRGAERRSVEGILHRVDVDRAALFRPARAFSGGNQQKMVFAKWLLPRARILLLYDPTRGVDVGAKHEIYVMMRELASEGAALLFYSTEVEELVNLPDRVIVLYAGRIHKELRGDDLASQSLLAAIMGVGDAGRETGRDGAAPTPPAGTGTS
jgi:ribose transport system ATP-binding protein